MDTIQSVSIAFFDFDRTLLAVNSAALWLRREFSLGNISFRQVAWASWWIARYHVGWAELEKVVSKAVETLRGTPAKPLQERSQKFYNDELRRLYRPMARQVVERHRHAGDQLVLLTDSHEYLAQQVVDEFSFDAYLCNRLEVDGEGLHTGKTVGGVCFGQGKLRHAQTYVSSCGKMLRDCSFYTDSYSDRSVLAEVGKPVAVNPDGRLRRLAQRQGWEIADWGEP